jgi:hypothetical protein
VRRVRARSAGALAIVAAAAGVAACSGSAPDATGRPGTSPPSITVPLDATFATESGAIAVVAMGRIGDPLNTFWELFSRPNSTSRWALVTPPGVADNGGLVASPGPNSIDGALLLTGFQPSQDLAFSPLALSTDQGGSWSPGLVPGGLAAVPDAVALSSGAESLALLRAGGGEVLDSDGNPSDWSELVGRSALVTTSAGRSCGVGTLTAVAFSDIGGPLVGTTCTAKGVVGIFGRTGRVWRLVGPRLSGPSKSAATKVLRLVDADGVASGLVAAATTSTTSLIGVASADGGRWSRSPPLSLAPGSRIVSTGVEPAGGFMVLTARPHGRPAIDVEMGPGRRWHSLPAPPPGTTAVVVGADGAVDALSVALVQLTDWRLDASAGTWSKIETVTVPIQFGSSS